MIEQNIPKPGTIIKQTLYMYLPEWSREPVIYTFKDSEYPLLCTAEVEFIMPDVSHSTATAIKIATLKEKIDSLNASNHVKINELKGKIQELMAIGYDGGDK